MTSTTTRPASPPLHTPTHEPPARLRSSLAGPLLAAVLLAATAFAGVAPLLSPPPPAEDAVAGFSLDRAREDLAVVAAAPHPMGSPEQATVEAYLVQELTAMGLAPKVQVETVTKAPDPPNSVWTGTVRNIVARVEGTPDNGWAMSQYLDASLSPVVDSAFGALLNATGQGADLGRYRQVVPAGLELVIIGGLPAYHAGTDTPAGMHEGTSPSTAPPWSPWPNSPRQRIWTRSSHPTWWPSRSSTVSPSHTPRPGRCSWPSSLCSAWSRR